MPCVCAKKCWAKMSLMLAPEFRKSNDRNQGANRMRALYLVHHLGDPHMEAHCIESKTKTQCAFLDTLKAGTIPNTRH